ncbi:hypothetical protein QMM42_17360, partial [Leptospira santarosai]|uniref:hypothetical protein n=1 Tax=Leptospira santarosai TaxID=28183 RepID=UPI0024AECDC1
MSSLKERLNIALLEKHQAWHEARGMLSPSKKLNANQLTTCKEFAIRFWKSGESENTESRNSCQKYKTELRFTSNDRQYVYG